ncbi:platelet glycoprotein Ib alpha chain-like [Mytilus trossulus]|uniref:platelet glycoprotein Ib alpha chain-like n=1 Tax=Mytilus trossulus TaxID=6551 RepID=UPI003006E3F3
MFNNSKKPLKQGKTPANYHQEIQCDIESAFDNLDLFTKKPDNVISFKPDHPPSYPVDDNDTTIPYVEDQPFFQSSPIHSNNFLSSWTGQPTLPSSITPLRPSIVRRPSIPSTLAKKPAPTTTLLQTPQHFSSLYPTLPILATTSTTSQIPSTVTATTSTTVPVTTAAGPGTVALTLAGPGAVAGPGPGPGTGAVAGSGSAATAHFQGMSRFGFVTLRFFAFCLTFVNVKRR